MVRPRFDAVLFDLLTALLDSRALWDKVAGSEADGRRWRATYLRNTYGTGVYRPYETLVEEAAVESGLPPRLAGELAARYHELQPWPEVGAVLARLKRAGLPLGVVTNCSQCLAEIAAGCTGFEFDVLVSAERAHFYKPDPHPYRMALAALGDLDPARVLFVAGSPYDLFGTAAVGLPTFWHDRLGLPLPNGAPAPAERHPTLTPLIEVVFGTS